MFCCIVNAHTFRMTPPMKVLDTKPPARLITHSGLSGNGKARSKCECGGNAWRQPLKRVALHPRAWFVRGGLHFSGLNMLHVHQPVLHRRSEVRWSLGMQHTFSTAYSCRMCGSPSRCCGSTFLPGERWWPRMNIPVCTSLWERWWPRMYMLPTATESGTQHSAHKIERCIGEVSIWFFISF